MGNLQRFRDLTFTDGQSRAAPITLPVGFASSCMRPKTCEMTVSSMRWRLLSAVITSTRNLVCCWSNRPLAQRPADRSSNHNGHTPCQLRILGLSELACRHLFCRFNFRGLPVNRKNSENWTPRKLHPAKFPFIRKWILHLKLHARKVWGHASPEEFQNFNTSGLLLVYFGTKKLLWVG